MTVARVAAKALLYAAALGGAGAVLWSAFLAPEAARRVRPLIGLLALIGLALVGLRLGLRGAGLTGDWDGMTDMDILGLLLGGPVGAVAAWRGVGFALLALWALVPRLGHAPGLLGAAALVWSFTVVGHVSALPRDWSAATLVHLAMAALWIGALLPLRRLARAGDPAAGAMAERFGRVAVWAVAALVLAGLALGWRLLGGIGPLVGTAYGWTLMGKLAVVIALLALAAHNKLRLSPALAAGDPAAGRRLARSIEWEVAAVAAILTLTAILTIVTPLPPVE
ncbi:MAG: copper resistance D family protein [Shimia sp.]